MSQVFDAKVVDYGCSATKKGEPMVMIRFKYDDGKVINWYGTFSGEKATEITCEALAVCGWSTNDPKDLHKGKGSGVLDENRTVSITIANEEWQGKVRQKVKYVNPQGGAGFRDKLDNAGVATVFKGLNVAAAAAAARNKHKKELPNMAPKFDQNEEISF